MLFVRGKAGGVREYLEAVNLWFAVVTSCPLLAKKKKEFQERPYYRGLNSYQNIVGFLIIIIV